MVMAWFGRCEAESLAAVIACAVRPALLCPFTEAGTPKPSQETDDEASDVDRGEEWWRVQGFVAPRICRCPLHSNLERQDFTLRCVAPVLSADYDTGHIAAIAAAGPQSFDSLPQRSSSVVSSPSQENPAATFVPLAESLAMWASNAVLASSCPPDLRLTAARVAVMLMDIASPPVLLRLYPVFERLVGSGVWNQQPANGSGSWGGFEAMGVLGVCRVVAAVPHAAAGVAKLAFEAVRGCLIVPDVKPLPTTGLTVGPAWLQLATTVIPPGPASLYCAALDGLLALLDPPGPEFVGEGKMSEARGTLSKALESHAAMLVVSCLAFMGKEAGRLWPVRLQTRAMAAGAHLIASFAAIKDIPFPTTLVQTFVLCLVDVIQSESLEVGAEDSGAFSGELSSVDAANDGILPPPRRVSSLVVKAHTSSESGVWGWCPGLAHVAARCLEMLMVGWAMDTPPPAAAVVSDIVMNVGSEAISKRMSLATLQSRLSLALAHLFIGPLDSGMAGGGRRMSEAAGRYLDVTEQVMFMLQGLRQGYSYRTALMCLIAPLTLSSFFPVDQAISHVVGEFLRHRQKYPHALAAVLAGLYALLRADGQQAALTHWTIMTVRNFVTMLPQSEAVWTVSCLFAAVSETPAIRALVPCLVGDGPHAGSTGEAGDRELFLCLAREFYRNRNLDEESRADFVQLFAEIPDLPFAAIVEELAPLHFW